MPESEADFEELELYLDAALEAGRRQALEARLEQDPDLRTLLGELRADRAMAERLRSTTFSGASGAAALDLAVFRPEIPGYAEPEPIHRGGQGAVFRALQESTRRPVAVKVLLPFSSEAQRHRFEREIDLVASFSHPNLVPVFDSGITAEGMPFFAMELIEGEPIDQVVAQRRLGIPATLDLVIKICRAVSYAHQRGVLHRDLKPANILAGADLEPRLLDFGVARPIEAAEQSLATAAGQFTGTIAYAAPEQLHGDPRRIDVRCDVYALGVILYQLLCGRLPHDTDQPIPQLIGQITSAPPEPPRRQGRPLPRDLETILHTALHKDPERRYAGVADLRRDLGHYLAGEAIDARRDKRLYVLGKTLQRHWAAATAAAVVFVSLLLATAVSTSFYQRARREAMTTKDVNLFFSEMLYEAIPANLGRDARLVDVLDAVADKVEERFADRPEVAAMLHRALGRTYLRLDRFEESARHLQRARPLFEELYGARHEDTLTMLTELAELQDARGKLDEALVISEYILEVRRAQLGEDHPDTLRARGNRAALWLDKGRHQAAVEELRSVVPALAAALGEAHKAHLGALAAWASGLRRLKRFDEAEPLARRVLALYEAAQGESPQTQSARNTLAVILDEGGKQGEAVQLYERVYAARLALHGADSPRTLTTLSNLALARWDIGQRAQALRELRGVLDGYLGKLGEGHPTTILATQNLANRLAAQGDFARATPLYQTAADAARAHLPARHFLRLVVLSRQGEYLRDRGRLEDAIPGLREAYEGLGEVAGAAHHETKRAGESLAGVLEQCGAHAEAAAIRAQLEKNQGP